MSGEIRWIVLIKKMPKGPFSLSELESLIAQGIVRRNDVAYQTKEGEEKAHSGWKFIWQFEEFDRRTPKPSHERPTPNEPHEDRRSLPSMAVNSPVNSDGANSGIDIESIKIEDLVVRETPKAEPSLRDQKKRVETPRKKIPMGWVFSGVGIASLIMYYTFTGSDTPPVTAESAVIRDTTRAPASVRPKADNPPHQRPGQSGGHAPQPQGVQPSLPQAPQKPREEPKDRGEVSRDDFKRRDREMDREPASEEEDEPIIIKKRKKKPIIIEEDEEASEESPIDEE